MPKRSIVRPRALCTLALLVLLSCSPLCAGTAEVARGDHGMVVGPEAHASRIGAEVLRDGGNAVDAAVAVAFALAVTYPQAGNLGGGGFLLYRSPDGRCHALDFRETAPAKLRPEQFLDEDGRPIPGLSVEGGLAVGVPGSVAGLAEAHRLWGSVEWASLLEPAIRLAEKGFPISEREADDLRRLGKRLLESPAAKRIFTRDGRWPEEGDRLIQRDLAETLRRIATEGRDGFYRGPVARAVARTVREAGGVMTRRDLRSYRPVLREPVEGRYRGYRIVSFPPPSSGGVALLQMLGMLERYDLGADGPAAALTIHRIVETERRAYADRSRWLGDPDLYPVPVAELLDGDYLGRRGLTIDDDQASPSARLLPGNPVHERSGNTTHFSVADRRGAAVALTTTLNSAYGSGIAAEGTGVLLNNEIDDFALAPGSPNLYGLVGGEANAVAARKRPLSSMTPTIVERAGEPGRPFLILGSPGGSRIITSVLQVLINVIDHGMPLKEAVDRPRFHHQWLPDEIGHEAGAFSASTIRELERRGHRLAESDRAMGNVNAIGLTPDGAWLGAADRRRGGSSAGY